MRRALLAAALGIAVYTVMVLVADIDRTGESLRTFDAAGIPLLLLLPLANYLFRFFKWQYFLRRTGIVLPAGRSLQVFLSGFAMTVSPGKFGELLKCCLLRDREGIPVERTSPVVFAERLTDLMSMILLAALGMALAGGGGAVPAVAAGVLFVSIVTVLLTSRRAFGILSSTACRLPRLKGAAGRLEEFRSSCSDLLDPASLLVSVPLGMVSWGLEAMVLVAAARAMGLELDPGTALLAHSAGTVAGAVSMIPGGLGLTEATIDGLLAGSLGLAPATAVTLVMRFSTLWFAVALGAATLALGRIPRRTPEAGSGE